jgi:hypothetical protein
MKTVYIIRYQIGDKQSLGTLLVVKDGRILFSSHLLERGWQNNQRNISCIPSGTYDLRKEYSSKFNRKLWEAYGVPNRSECKFHASNFWKQLNGCFAPGEARVNIGSDSELDMVNSADMLDSFMDAMGTDTRARLVVINDNQS